jgi:hypothetical protein
MCVEECSASDEVQSCLNISKYATAFRCVLSEMITRVSHVLFSAFLPTIKSEKTCIFFTSGTPDKYNKRSILYYIKA